MKTTKSKGFTLIELLVVIAIIGILAAIVLASLSTARTKAQAAKVTGQLDEMRNAAEIYYSAQGSYSNTVGTQVAGLDCNVSTNSGNLFLETSSGMNALVAGTIAVPGVGNANIDCGVSGANATAWSVASALPGGGFFCVDSTGVARSTLANGVAYSNLVNALANNGAHNTAGNSACQ